MDSLTAEKPSVSASGFAKIPLEIRDDIYKMLLTTLYCADVDSTGQRLEFDLHTEIIYVNKAISAEGLRVFYEENRFVAIKVSGFNLYLGDVPSFRRLSEHKIENYLLQVGVSVAEEKQLFQFPIRVVTRITTIHGLQSFIGTIWNLEKIGGGGPHVIGNIYNEDLKFHFKFNLKVTARYEVLSDLVLKPWERVNGVKEVEWLGDIPMPMVRRLERHMLYGPSPRGLIETLEQSRLLSECNYRRQDYNDAPWRWKVFFEYWYYLHLLDPQVLGGCDIYEPGSPIWQAVRMSLLTNLEGLLGYWRKSFSQLRYQDLVWNVGIMLTVCTERSWIHPERRLSRTNFTKLPRI
jgi:hypothetical protein